MHDFIFKIDNRDAGALAAVRCMQGLQASEDSDFVWLRFSADLLNRESKLKQLPAKETFLINEHNHLFPPRGLTPVGSLPQLLWQPLNEFLKVELPPSLLPGKINGLIDLKLVPTEKAKDGAALLTSLHLWKSYAEAAPAVRLRKLKFAVSENNEVLVVGNPLPPLPGKEYWIINDILLPCGYDFEITIAAAFVQKKLNNQHHAVILFRVDGDWIKIDKAYFVEAKRSAIRLTSGNAGTISLNIEPGTTV